MELVFKLVLATFFIAEIPVTLGNDDPFGSLVKRVDALEARNDEVEARNEALSDENEDLKARIEALEVIATSQQEQIKRLVAASEEHTANHKDFAGDVSESGDNERRNGKALSERSQDKARAMSRIRKASNEMSVAFFAVLNHHIDSPGVHQAVAFDKVITNVGNAYNPHAGDFRAPVSGVYVFSTTMMAGSDSVQYHFQIMRNGSAVANLFIPHGGMASQEAIFHLNQGDDVAIHNLDAGHRVYGNWYSSFSGFLLQEDIPDVGLVGK